MMPGRTRMAGNAGSLMGQRRSWSATGPSGVSRLDQWGRRLFLGSFCLTAALHLYLAIGDWSSGPAYASDGAASPEPKDGERGLELTTSVEKPVALLVGRVILAVDAKGRAAPLEAVKGPQDLPVITGVGLQDGEALAPALEALERLRKSSFALYGRLSELHCTQDGEWIAYLVDHSLPVALGSGPLMEKLELLAKTLPVLEKEEDLSRVTDLDLRFDSQIVVRYAHGRSS
ncbi:MAG: cell division protein FtsQ [candidate division KSB1 bacterium]|nr:cell division protein FtsQ [candidate division KSB1 bacterium]